MDTICNAMGCTILICCVLARSVPTWTDCLRKAEAPIDKNESCTFERQEEKAGTTLINTIQPLYCETCSQGQCETVEGEVLME